MTVNGDTRPELDETFSLTLTKPGNGHFPANAASLTATGTIVNDDTANVCHPVTANAFVAVSPPASVTKGAQTSDRRIIGFGEQQGYTLGSAGLAVDISAPGCYDRDSPMPGLRLPAGTIVNSFLLHADRATPNAIIDLEGEATIDSDIIGVILNDAPLDASDAVTGWPYTVYPTGLANRGAVADPAEAVDWFEIDANRRTIRFHFQFSSAVDQVRILTQGRAAPTITIGDVKRAEGNAGTQTFSFPVSLSAAVADNDVRLTYATADGTATLANNDYERATGSLVIPAGQTTGRIEVTVNGDTRPELDETFSLTLTKPGNGQFPANAANLTATGTIVNDDGINLPPEVDAGSNRTTQEGNTIELDASARDPEKDRLTITWTFSPGANVDAGATCQFSGSDPDEQRVNCTDDGTFTLTMTVSDGINRPVSDSMTLTVTNRAPSVEINSPAANARFLPTANVPLSATITDRGSNDTHTCSIDWGDGLISAGVVAARICTGSHTYAWDNTFNWRSFTIRVTATDDDGASGFDTRSIISDPCTIRGTDKGETLNGTPGDDVICGMGGDDILNGDAGNDLLLADAGNDTLNGGAGDDAFDGGEGQDTASFDGGPAVAASLLSGQATGWGTDTLVRIENLVGSANADTLAGDGNSNRIEGGGGDDTIGGDAGPDTLIGGPDNDTIKGDAGGDTIIGGAGSEDVVTYSGAPGAVRVNLRDGTASGWGSDDIQTVENVIGSAFNDDLTGNGQANRLEGRDGDDTIDGRAGDDQLLGGDGTDTVTYADSPNAAGVNVDLRSGTATGWGIDTLRSIENVIGSDYDDSIAGNDASNRLVGGNGDDILNGRDSADDIVGGNGIDRVSYAGAPGGVTVNLSAGASSGTWGPDSITSVVNISGSKFDDVLTGNDRVNVIWGDDGDDRIDARDRADTVYGGDGQDTIIGGPGDDTLLGENGSDLLNGGVGDDEMFGGLGSDILLGGEGADRMAGDVGTDPTSSAGDPDHMNGGPGNDLMYGQGGNECSTTFGDHPSCDRTNHIPIDIVGPPLYYAQMEGGGGQDRLHGGPGDDRLDGGAQDDNDLVGGAGINDFCSFGPLPHGDRRDVSCELPSVGDANIRWQRWAW